MSYCLVPTASQKGCVWFEQKCLKSNRKGRGRSSSSLSIISEEEQPALNSSLFLALYSVPGASPRLFLTAPGKCWRSNLEKTVFVPSLQKRRIRKNRCITRKKMMKTAQQQKGADCVDVSATMMLRAEAPTYLPENKKKLAQACRFRVAG